MELEMRGGTRGGAGGKPGRAANRLVSGQRQVGVLIRTTLCCWQVRPDAKSWFPSQEGAWRLEGSCPLERTGDENLTMGNGSRMGVCA